MPFSSESSTCPRQPEDLPVGQVDSPLGMMAASSRMRLLAELRAEQARMDTFVARYHEYIVRKVDSLFLYEAQLRHAAQGDGSECLSIPKEDVSRIAHLSTPESSHSFTRLPTTGKGSRDLQQEVMEPSEADWSHVKAGAENSEDIEDIEDIEAGQKELEQQKELQLQLSGQSSPARPSHQRDSIERARRLVSQFRSRTSRVLIAPGERLFQKKLNKGSNFDIIVGVLILLNVVINALQLQWEGNKRAAALGLETRNYSGDRVVEQTFVVLEHIFNAVYILEIFVRIQMCKRDYFRDWSNLFDVLLVIFTSLDLYILSALASRGSMTVLRSLRLLKTVRGLRAVRLVKLVGELRVLVKTILSSFRALGWSMVMLGLVVLVSGIVLCQFVQADMADESLPAEFREWMWFHYGTAVRSSYTMFEVLNAGSWPAYVRPLLENVSWWYAVFFILYVFGVVFAMKTIISALFLKETLSAASQDLEDIVAEATKKRESYMGKLREFFMEADTSGDGALSLEEFKEIIANPKVKSWLQVLELEVHESEDIFGLIDEGKGHITVEEFMNGVARLKGHSRSVDIIAIQRELKKLDHIHAHLTDLVRVSRGSAIFPMLDTSSLMSAEDLRKDDRLPY
mmetsp:Transcript_23482/g.51945  ORF Transcript_23482/g.51945 Transcript_23482/m.51945 type:complete len:627 (+) Transcript_23482:38-1918(+)